MLFRSHALGLSVGVLDLLLTCGLPISLSILPLLNLFRKIPGSVPVTYLLSFLAQAAISLVIPVSFLLTPLIVANLAIFLLKFKNLKPFWKANVGLSVVSSILIILLALQYTAIIPSNESSVKLTTLEARQEPSRISFFVEWYFTHEDIECMFSKDALDLLKGHGASIYLRIPECNLTANSHAEKVTKLLNKEGIPTWAWLTTKPEHGYYYSDETARYFPGLVQRVHAWADSRDLSFKGMMLDAEPSLQHRRSQSESAKRGDYLGAWSTIRSQFNDTAHDSSLKMTKQIVHDLHSFGYEAAYCGPDLYLEDFQDGDEDLMQLHGVPGAIDGFDKFIPMIYRSLYPWTEKLDHDYYIYSSAKHYLERYGSQLSVALGTLGKGAYGSPREGDDGLKLLRSDVLVLRNLGVPEIPLWCLEWLLWHRWSTYSSDLEYILSSATGPAMESSITFSPMHLQVRSILLTLDFLMDTSI